MMDYPSGVIDGAIDGGGDGAIAGGSDLLNQLNHFLFDGGAGVVSKTSGGEL